MGKVVLISCSSKKSHVRTKAENLYISPLFKLSLAYALSLKPEKVFILSAKYGLVDLKNELNPYDLTLNKMTASEVKSWAEKVGEQMKGKINSENDEIIFLAGEKYRKYLEPLFKKIIVPLKGLGIGKQLQFLKNNTENAK